MTACSNTAPPLPRRAGSSAASLRRCLHILPRTARDLVRVLGGLEPVLALVSALGGVTVRVPARRGETRAAGDTLRAVVGPWGLRRLVEHYGGTELYIPRCAQPLRRVRNAAIIENFSACAAQGESSGAAVRRLALEYGLSDRRIWEILKTCDPIPPAPPAPAPHDAPNLGRGSAAGQSETNAPARNRNIAPWPEVTDRGAFAG